MTDFERESRPDSAAEAEQESSSSLACLESEDPDNRQDIDMLLAQPIKDLQLRLAARGISIVSSDLTSARGIEDWRDPANYEYTSELTLHQWAWEFLRRNKDYREIWDLLCTRKKKLQEVGAPLEEQEKLHLNMGSHFGMGWALDYRLRAYEATQLYWTAAAGVRFIYYFGNPNPYAPEKDRPWPGYPGGLAVLFDLTQPIPPQVEKINQLLKSYQGKLVHQGVIKRPKASKLRARRDLFPLYLRILDADLVGLSPSKIGRELLPNSFEPRDKVRSYLKSARSLSEKRYRELLLKADV